MLVPHPRGNFQFIRGGAAYSSAVAADPGYAITHVTLSRPLPVATGFDFIHTYLAEQGRPAQAVCAIQLRSPRPLTFDEFGGFNTQVYRPALEQYDLLVDGVSPMTRSNLAVEINPPSEVVLYAFGYTVPALGQTATRDLVLAGAGDVYDDPANPRRIVRDGETSDDAMRERTVYVMGQLQKRLGELNAAWADCTAVNLYTVQNVYPFLREVLLEPLGRAQMEGIRWYYMRPPIQGLEVEVDARRVSREVYVP